MKTVARSFFPAFLLASLFVSCVNPDDGTDGGETDGIKKGKVVFFNESSYTVKVHRDAFSGPVITELSSGSSKTVDVRVSDAHGFGTTFSVEYLYRITDGFDADSGTIFASGLDFNVQINRVIEENKSITVQIPQPQELEFRVAFVKILNAHNLPVELRYYGRVLRQAGNDLYVVAPGKTGIYKLDDIPDDKPILYEGLNVVSTMESTGIASFTAKNGVIYSFTYNGKSVTKTGEQTIVFN
ncbi:MAG: hypothetical protein FWD94_03775 [Treponema sp.]|nr:hypothetical protein [Treponema sp.]